MNGLPPADLEKLVSAQQLVIGRRRTANHISRQANHAPGQQPSSIREGKVECNNNLTSSNVEDRRYPQGVEPERRFDFQKEGYLEYSNCERRNVIELEGRTNVAHVSHEMGRGVGEEKNSGYIRNVLSNGWTMEDGVQTDDRGSTNQDGCSTSYSSYSSSASFNIENPSLLAPSNLSTATTTQCFHPLVGNQTPSPPPSLPPSLPPQLLKPGSSTLFPPEKKILLETACSYPDTIVWSGIKKCDVDWNKEGRLGFKIIDRISKDGSEIYAMVTSVQRGSTADLSGLRPGDHVLSVNGTPIHQKQTKEGMSTTQIFRQQSQDSPVSIFFQRPKSTREKPSAASELSSLEGTSRQGSFRMDDAPMARLPDLRLVIMGSSAENIAEQFVGSKIWSERQDGPISIRCCMNIRKKDNIFEYLSVKSHQVIDILKLLDSRKTCPVGSNGIRDSSAASENVVLEVVVLKDSRLAIYCSQLVMTSHCMYMVGFDGQSFLENTEKHMRELQEKLNKIRTYAGSESPLYLISTWQHLSAVTLESIEEIGMQLHQRFGEAFGVQLQYHGNCPCFMLNRISSSQRQSSSQVPLHSQCQYPGEGRVDLTLTQDQGAPSVVKFCTQNSTSTSSSSSSGPMSMFSGSTCFSEFGPEACLTFLRDHIAKTIFEQSFVKMKAYPQKFLSYRDIVIGLRDQKQKCIMTSGIMKACRINDGAELTSLLEYLHRQGVIILSDNEKDTPNHSFVALNPEDLVHTCMRLLEVPDKSQQDQSFRHHWSILQKESILTPALLTHLLGMESDSACITACLKQLNLIHDYSGLPSSHLFCDSLQMERRSTQALYLMPFHTKKLVPRGTAHGRDLSSERTLLADFKGYCPHGLFSKLAIGLARLITSEMVGTFEQENETSWVFNMGGNYTLYMSEDPGRCVVKFAVRCKVGFPLQNVLNDIRTAVMKVVTSDHCFSLGPPCPMDQRCRFQQESSHLPVPHIIDLSKEFGERPLWCGDEDVRKFMSVKQWIVSSGKQMRGSPPVNTAGRILHTDTPFPDFPPDLLQLICDKLNAHSPTGKNYRGLAGELGYTISAVKLFEETSLPHQHLYHYDPCRHLLEDWGKSPNSTLGNLINVLRRPSLNRQDVIMEITRKWKVMDN